MLISSNIKLEGLLQLENCAITRSRHEYLLYVRPHPMSPRQCVHDLIDEDIAGCDESYVAKPTMKIGEWILLEGSNS